MSEPKDIFDLFREGEKDLQEKPSEEVWSQVTKRLEQRRKKQRRTHYIGVDWMHLTLIVLVLALVMLCALYLIYKK